MGKSKESEVDMPLGGLCHHPICLQPGYTVCSFGPASRRFGEEVSDVWAWWDEGQDSGSMDEDAKDGGINTRESSKSGDTKIIYSHEVSVGDEISL